MYALEISEQNEDPDNSKQQIFCVSVIRVKKDGLTMNWQQTD